MWLMLNPDQEFSVSDLAKRLEVPLSTLHREVVRLNDAGLIASRVSGRNRLLRANTGHPASAALTQLLEVTFGPKVVVAEEFALAGAEHVVIFGSWAARYAGQAGSPPRDIDVLVVGKVDRADLYDAADRCRARLGIEVNPVVRTTQQWDDPSDALVTQIKNSAYVTVYSNPGLVATTPSSRQSERSSAPDFGSLARFVDGETNSNTPSDLATTRPSRRPRSVLSMPL